jgi:hypothetical protein
MKESGVKFLMDWGNHLGVLYLDAGNDFWGGVSLTVKERQVVCIPLARIRRDHTGNDVEVEERAIILVPTRQKPKEFRRVGLAIFGSGKRPLEGALDFWKENPSCWEHGGQTEKITIV